MKKLWNSFKIAFAMYSKIPMPQSEWTEENMAYAMCFFPVVGVIIGALVLSGRAACRSVKGKRNLIRQSVFFGSPDGVTGSDQWRYPHGRISGYTGCIKLLAAEREASGNP